MELYHEFEGMVSLYSRLKFVITFGISIPSIFLYKQIDKLANVPALVDPR